MSSKPLSHVTEEAIEAFAECARSALRVASMSPDSLVDKLLELMPTADRPIFRSVVVAAVDRAIDDLKPVGASYLRSQ